MDYCNEHKEIKEKINEIYKLTLDIYNSLRGDLEKAGWLTRIETIERHDRFLIRVFIYLGTILGTGILTFIWALLTNTINITFTK